MNQNPHEQSPQADDFPEIEGYDVIDLVGIGGMGAVYEAIQRATGRRVALKVILESVMGSDSARQRFEREVEFIARLDHPNIVAVIDSGAHNGRRYCVMDFVEGRTLDEALTPGQCDTKAALETTERIARAVDYAHQRGVLHRDLKPSNILIDERAEPRLLDFGLAKAIDPVSAMGGRRTISEQGQLIGTVAYMAPEQARGDLTQLSVRTDVYALGAIAYELLTGELPVSVSGSLGESLSRLETRDPPRPSSLRRGLGADTDAILLKALEKNPARRYETAGALADDIRRRLDGYPVRARRVGPAQRFGRWINRNRTLSTVAGAAAVVLLTTGAVATWRVLDEGGWRREVDQQWVEIFDALDPNALGGQDVTVRALLEREAARLETGAVTDARVECEFRRRLGGGFLAVREFDQAESHLRAALDLQERTGVGGRAGRAAILHDLAAALWWKGQYADAEPLYRRALELRTAALGPEHPETAETMDHLASTLDRLDRAREAEPIRRRALDILRATLGPDHEQTIAGSMSLGVFLLREGRHAEAEPLLRDATDRIRRLRGERHEGVAVGLSNLGACLIELGRWREARDALHESRRLKRLLWGEHNDSYAWTLHQLARIAHHDGDAQAETLAHTAAATLTATVGPEHQKTLQANALLQRIRAGAPASDPAQTLESDPARRPG